MELLRAREQVRFRLRIAGVGDAAVDRAHRGAGLLVVEADALGAERRIDDEDVLALADRLVRTLRLTGAAVDAFLGEDRGQSGLRVSRLVLTRVHAACRPDVSRSRRSSYW